MDTSNIPKSFWHSISFCIVASTIGVLAIAYKSATVSIEIANAKISLSSALHTVKEIKSDLEMQNQKLITANKALQEEANKAAAPPAYSASSTNPEEILQGGRFGRMRPEVRYIDPKIFKDLDSQIKSIDGAVRN